jgi:hypothetical protein
MKKATAPLHLSFPLIEGYKRPAFYTPTPGPTRTLRLREQLRHLFKSKRHNETKAIPFFLCIVSAARVERLTFSFKYFHLLQCSSARTGPGTSYASDWQSTCHFATDCIKSKTEFVLYTGCRGHNRRIRRSNTQPTHQPETGQTTQLK